MTQEERYEIARKRVEELKGFYKNLFSYATINILLIVINLATSPKHLWFYWVTIFWGIGVLFHAAHTYLFRGKFLGKDWEEKKIKEIMEKEAKIEK
jgi:hypothetical protein